RVRCARHRLLSKALPSDDAAVDVRKKSPVIGLRGNASALPIGALAKHLTSAPEGPDKLATILLEEVQQLAAMDRYEGRAFSQRKFAIRAFDLAYQDFGRTKPK